MTIDVKAREAIMQLANALYGTSLSMVFVKGLADDLFAPKQTKKRKVIHRRKKHGEG